MASESNEQFAARQREKRGESVLVAPEPEPPTANVCSNCGVGGGMEYGIVHDVTKETYLGCSKACWAQVVVKYGLRLISC